MGRVSFRGRKSLAKVKLYEKFLIDQAQTTIDSISFFALEHLKWMAMQNFSPVTIENRKRYIAYFAMWAKENGIIDAKKVSRHDLDAYKKYVFDYKKSDGLPLTIRSQWSRLEPLRSFFSWMAKKYHILYNPASELDLPKIGQSLPGQILTEEQVSAIMDQPDLKTRRGIRDRAILEVFYSTGIRRLELTNLNTYDVNFARETLTIKQGKGHKDRVVPLGKRAAGWVLRYLDEVRPHFLPKEGETDILFLTNAGDSLRANYLTWKVKDYIKAAGVLIIGSCHMFRHSMATSMLENGADIRYIQEILGHSKLETTQIYTKVSIERLKEVHAKTHPSEKY